MYSIVNLDRILPYRISDKQILSSDNFNANTFQFPAIVPRFISKAWEITIVKVLWNYVFIVAVEPPWKVSRPQTWKLTDVFPSFSQQLSVALRLAHLTAWQLKAWHLTTWHPDSWQPDIWQPDNLTADSLTSDNLTSWQPDSWQPDSLISWEPDSLQPNRLTA